MKRLSTLFNQEIEDEEIEFLTNYILEKCTFCFLIITGEGAEDHAIDIFNSLNSTGEPLSAFEILKSSIHKKDKRTDLVTRFNKIEKDIGKVHPKRIGQIRYTDRLLLFINMITKSLQISKSMTSFRDKRELIDKIIKDENEIKRCVEQIDGLHKFISEEIKWGVQKK